MKQRLAQSPKFDAVFPLVMLSLLCGVILFFESKLQSGLVYLIGPSITLRMLRTNDETGNVATWLWAKRSAALAILLAVCVDYSRNFLGGPLLLQALRIISTIILLVGLWSLVGPKRTGIAADGGAEV